VTRIQKTASTVRESKTTLCIWLIERLVEHPRPERRCGLVVASNGEWNTRKKQNADPSIVWKVPSLEPYWTQAAIPKRESYYPKGRRHQVAGGHLRPVSRTEIAECESVIRWGNSSTQPCEGCRRVEPLRSTMWYEKCHSVKKAALTITWSSARASVEAGETDSSKDRNNTGKISH